MASARSEKQASEGWFGVVAVAIAGLLLGVAIVAYAVDVVERPEPPLAPRWLVAWAAMGGFFVSNSLTLVVIAVLRHRRARGRSGAGPLVR